MTQKPPSVNGGASDEITATAPPEDDDKGAGTDAQDARDAQDTRDARDAMIAAGETAATESATADSAAAASAAVAPAPEAPEGAEGPDESKAAAESYDDSLEAILLQASARPPEAPAPKILGSKTLMGIGIDSLNLSAILASAKTKTEARSENQTDGAADPAAAASESRRQSDPAAAAAGSNAAASERTATGNEIGDEMGSAAPAPTADGPREEGGANLEGLARSEAKLAATIASGEGQVTSLLDEVAQALNVQATEYRDRARGRLPGMPSPSAAATVAAFSKAGVPRTAVEFEDPDDGPTALTPGVISVVDEHDEASLNVLVDAEDPAEIDEESSDESVVLGPAAFGGAGAARSSAPIKTDGRSGPAAPTHAVPHAGFPASGPVVVVTPAGSPASHPSAPNAPNAPVRTSTPMAGLPAPAASGRVHLPTPLAGASTVHSPVAPSASAPPPAIGRLTLPLGAPNPALGAHKDSELTATAPSTPISLEASRRVAAGMSAAPTSGQASTGSGRVSPGSGRVTARGSGRVTEPVRHAVSVLPAVLTAHVRLATVSLAALVAVTFAGGLLVGMLVWKGQGRGDGATGRVVAAPSPSAPSAPSAPSSPAAAAAPAVQEATPPPPAVSNTPTAADNPPSVAGSAAASGEAGGLPTEAIVTPLVVDSPAISETPPEARPVRRVAASRPPRPKPPTAAVAAEVAAPPKAAAAVAKPAALVAKPAARPATPSSASKPMAANGSGAKPPAKSKAKAEWHDPFAD